MTTKHTLTIIQQNPKPPNDGSPSQPLSVTYPCHLDSRRLGVQHNSKSARTSFSSDYNLNQSSITGVDLSIIIYHKFNDVLFCMASSFQSVLELRTFYNINSQTFSTRISGKLSTNHVVHR